MHSVGEKLRSERQRQNLSISAIASETCISARYLEAIEQDDLSVLPGGFFYKSFVKQYSSALGLDFRSVESDVEKAMPTEVQDPLPALSGSYQIAKTEGRISLFPNRAVWAASLLLSTLAGGGGFYHWWQKNQPGAGDPAPDPVQVVQAAPAVAPPVPDKIVSAVETIAAPAADTPKPDAGIATTFDFASPQNKQATGPLDHFTLIVKSPGYLPMLNCKKITYDPVIIDGDSAQQRVHIVAADGSKIAYVFLLSLQKDGPFAGCWMNDGCVRDDSDAERHQFDA